jgi:hypothetical protein
MTTKTIKQRTTARKKRGVVSLSLKKVKAFTGFKQTVAEGKKLSRRSHTEFPEFPKIAREK